MRSRRANGRTTGAAAPFCPGGRDVGTRCRAIEELDQVCRLAAFRQHLEECLEYPGATEPPEPLPYAVPFAKVARKCAPRYAVHSEVVDGFQELTVIMPWLAPARLRRIKHFQHDRPIALRHSRQHVRLPDAGHAVIRTKPDSGICQKRIAGIPSTRPREVPSTEGQPGTSRWVCRRRGDGCRSWRAGAAASLPTMAVRKPMTTRPDMFPPKQRRPVSVTPPPETLSTNRSDAHRFPSTPLSLRIGRAALPQGTVAATQRQHLSRRIVDQRAGSANPRSIG